MRCAKRLITSKKIAAEWLKRSWRSVDGVLGEFLTDEDIYDEMGLPK